MAEFPLRDIAMQRRRVVFVRRYPITEECSICYSNMGGRPATVYPCGHATHCGCAKRLRQSTCPTRHNCPLCRQVVDMWTEDGEDEEDVAFVRRVRIVFELFPPYRRELDGESDPDAAVP